MHEFTLEEGEQLEGEASDDDSWLVDDMEDSPQGTALVCSCLTACPHSSLCDRGLKVSMLHILGTCLLTFAQKTFQHVLLQHRSLMYLHALSIMSYA